MSSVDQVWKELPFKVEYCNQNRNEAFSVLKSTTDAEVGVWNYVPGQISLSLRHCEAALILHC